MKLRTPKTCGKGSGLTWARRVDAGVVTWSLFRRDHRRAVHQFQVQLGICADAGYAAHLLRNARRRLRDQVDEIDLRAMERDNA
jgi:hypothetical protein